MKNKLVWILIIVGTLFQLITVFRSGQNCNLGICFWGPNGHDGIWHLALGRQAIKNIPPSNPVYSGSELRGYHWGYDLLLGTINKYLPISVSKLHFQVLPFIFSFFLGVISFYLGKLLTGSKLVGFWFAFLNYFANSLGWVVNLIRNGKISGESLFWAMQSPSFLLNPPFAMSVLILLLGCFLWRKWQSDLDWKRILFLGLLFGSLLNVKAYAAVLFVLAVGLTFLIQPRLIRFKNLVLLFLTGIICVLSWLSWHKGGQFPFIFKPLWFVRTMLEAKDRLYLPKLGQMWWILVKGWFLNPRFWLIAGLGTVAFLIGNFNLRLLGVFEIDWSAWEINYLILIILSIFFPLFFVQRGTAWNTIQFLYYGLIFGNYFLAKYLSRLWKRKKIVVFGCLLVLVIGNLETAKTYLTINPTAYIPNFEAEALSFLEEEKKGTVLGFPFQPELRNKMSPPLPLYVYESTAYLSAYTGKRQFVADRMNLDITGYNWKERLEEKKKFFRTDDKIWARGFLLNNKIDYIYLVNDQDLSLLPEELGLEMIYDQDNVNIYQVLK